MAETNIFVEPRKQFVNWIRKQLIGPPPVKDNPEDPELIGVNPTERFPCGALYPISEWGDGVDPAGEELEEIDADLPKGDEAGIEPAIIRRYAPPSSLGFSFFINGKDINFQVLCSAACYKPQGVEISPGRYHDEKGRFVNKWKRKILGDKGNDEQVINISCPGRNGTRQHFDVFEDKARVEVLWRSLRNGWIVTVSLCNQQLIADNPSQGYSAAQAEKTLFEVQLRCVIDDGEIGSYPRVDRSLLDEEEQEVELQYAHRHIYAVGHGCAVDWVEQNKRVIELYSDALPSFEVPQVTVNTVSKDKVLSMDYLADHQRTYDQQLDALLSFINDYKDWVEDQQKECVTLAGDDQGAGQRIVKRMELVVTRMSDGLNLLKQDSKARKAFALANRAMLDQMRQNDQVRGSLKDIEDYSWRPFQLAFLLTALESTAHEDSEYRDHVDLIWFPTGGGKTEAYLGLIAFQIILRRLRHQETGGGTTVIMRYTLRLLTKDQFLRATRMIFALELLRKKYPKLGSEPISIGLWVGAFTSPNNFRDAVKTIDQLRQGASIPELVLEQCPWCGQKFRAEQNYESTDSSFYFLCRNSDCPFGSTSTGRLPCNVVDEALYAEPPTMLVGTIDKFARLAWEERSNAFFGRGKVRPPELIIQDELHLISGALGSVAGVYEAGIDTVLRLRGVYPKYIASTATIRMAREQVRRLYGREVAIFPPPGLSCDDSFFARTVPISEHPGRLYIGYLAPLLNRQKCMAPLAATLLLAPLALFSDQQNTEDLLEAWWTQVVFHGSLKGVGNSAIAFDSSVRDFIKLIKLQKEPSDRWPLDIRQLTSLQSGEDNAVIFNRLTKKRGTDECLDGVLGTNMISVGLDVGRLALMVINGQPLTTAEYIQASSRVGRSEVPGLVFTNYYRDQARSLSHYEAFRAYHEAFYRFVEPTSVTPYAYQARLRALHTALVIVVRHAGCGLLANAMASQFDPTKDKVIKAIKQLKLRCAQAVQSQDLSNIDSHINEFVSAWQDEVYRCKQNKRALDYSVLDSDRGRDRLLFSHESKINGLWATLHSMRNVEHTALLKVL